MACDAKKPIYIVCEIRNGSSVPRRAFTKQAYARSYMRVIQEREDMTLVMHKMRLDLL